MSFICFCVIIWKAKELRKAAIRHCPKHHIAVKEFAVDVKTGDRLDSTAPAKPLEVKDATQIQEIPVNVDAPAPGPERKATTIATGARKLGGEKTTVGKAKTKPTLDVPKSAYEFEKAWYVSGKLAYFEKHFHCIHFHISRNHLKTNTKEFNDYLKVRPCGNNFLLLNACSNLMFITIVPFVSKKLIKPVKYAKIFKQSVNDDILSSILRAINEYMIRYLGFVLFG
jgi:hypothetical protein